MRDTSPAHAMLAGQIGLVNRSGLQEFLELIGDMKRVGARWGFLFDPRRSLCFQ